MESSESLSISHASFLGDGNIRDSLELFYEQEIKSDYERDINQIRFNFDSGGLEFNELEEAKRLDNSDEELKENQEDKEDKKKFSQKEIISCLSESVLSQDSESELLKCSVCYDDSYQKASLCRFCGNSACSQCWSNIFTRNSKCPFCRKSLRQNDLVNDLRIDQIRQKERKPKSSAVKSLNKECYDHEDEGKLFCESCSTFLCLDCITSGKHTNHKICDINDNPRLQKKIEDTHTFCKKLQEDTKSLEKVISKHEEFFDTNLEDLEQVIEEVKEKVMARLTQNGDALVSKLTLGNSLNAEAKDQCGKLKLITRKIAKLGLKTIEIEQLKEAFTKQSQIYEAPNIAEFAKAKTLTESDLKELFALNIDYTDKAKFSEIILSELKQGINGLFS
ncbi:unnamed protein product [Moneuplotes crassus]|uniref:Uncharacterized protein n=1 Tax=Euplotes crassus TaxID=5936 RepID=A0AAD1XBR2_EUPCR|nr:unnamed protein product [Moneuplotes crassus]